jgi:hypothetical protein
MRRETLPLELGEELEVVHDDTDNSVGLALTCDSDSKIWFAPADMDALIAMLQRMQARQRGQG